MASTGYNFAGMVKKDLANRIISACNFVRFCLPPK